MIKSLLIATTLFFAPLPTMASDSCPEGRRLEDLETLKKADPGISSEMIEGKLFDAFIEVLKEEFGYVYNPELFNSIVAVRSDKHPEIVFLAVLKDNCLNAPPEQVAADIFDELMKKARAKVA